MIFSVVKIFGFLGIFDPPYCGIGATIRIGLGMYCLPYGGFLLRPIIGPQITWSILGLSKSTTLPPPPGAQPPRSPPTPRPQKMAPVGWYLQCAGFLLWLSYYELQIPSLEDPLFFSDFFTGRSKTKVRDWLIFSKNLCCHSNSWTVKWGEEN